MKIYVASSFLNKDAAREMQDLLKRYGHEITYDWTQHPSSTDWGIFREECKKDLQGIVDADALVVVLPGRLGTASELGIALALDKLVFVWYPDVPTMQATLDNSVFWHHINVWITDDAIRLVQELEYAQEELVYVRGSKAIPTEA